jgi:hypothetical protein
MLLPTKWNRHPEHARDRVTHRRRWLSGYTVGADPSVRQDDEEAHLYAPDGRS